MKGAKVRILIELMDEVRWGDGAMGRWGGSECSLLKIKATNARMNLKNIAFICRSI
jgi:hypothetical protein